jgi:hypothetical protein
MRQLRINMGEENENIDDRKWQIFFSEHLDADYT